MKYGIIDIGSNSIRLSVYRCENGTNERLMNRKEMTGLAGYVREGQLTDEGICAACETLSSFRCLLDNLNIGEYRVFATASLRNVSNTDAVVAEICQETGLSVDVISGPQEGILSLHGAMQDTKLASGLMMDLGGGSTELVRFTEGEIDSAVSLPVGSLSLFRTCVHDLCPTKEERQAITGEVNRHIKRLVRAVAPTDTLIGVGGTVRAVCKLINSTNRRPVSCRSFSAEDLNELYQLLKKPTPDSQMLLLKHAPDRLHTLMPGILVLRAVVKTYGIKEIVVSQCGVREGYLLDCVLSAHSEEVK